MGKTQVRIAETEKYAHVTFFFNGGVEKCNEGEDRVPVPSPKVATYDLKPEMSAYEVCDKAVEAIRSGKYGFAYCELCKLRYGRSHWRYGGCRKGGAHRWMSKRLQGLLMRFCRRQCDCDGGSRKRGADGITIRISLTAHTTNPCRLFWWILQERMCICARTVSLEISRLRCVSLWDCRCPKKWIAAA